MLRQTSKGWLALTIAGALLMGIGGAHPATAADPLDGRLIAAASSKESKGAAAEAPSLPETAAAPADAGLNGTPSNGAPAKINSNGGPEKISVTFEEPERDIMTRQAMDKLNVVVESL